MNNVKNSRQDDMLWALAISYSEQLARHKAQGKAVTRSSIEAGETFERVCIVADAAGDSANTIIANWKRVAGYEG